VAENVFLSGMPQIALGDGFRDATEDALIMDNVVSLVEAGCIDVQITF
jgi:hypothetical protein